MTRHTMESVLKLLQINKKLRIEISLILSLLVI